MLYTLTSETKSLLDERIRTSQLLGGNAEFVLHGGGNTSLKSKVITVTGKEVTALFVKGSGSDLSIIEADGFTALDLEGLLEAKDLKEVNDDDMTMFFQTNMLDPNQSAPSVETFLHAFIPYRYVDHSHADYVVAVTNTDLTDDQIKDIFGGRIIVLPYRHPGFQLAEALIETIGGHDFSEYDGVILRNHGLVTWGDSAEESYRKHVNLVRKAESAVRSRWSGIKPAEADERELGKFIEFLPYLRGILSKQNKKILTWNNEPEAVGYSLTDLANALQSLGPATPDMLVRTKKDYLYLASIDEAKERIEEYMEKYTKDFDKNVGRRYRMHDPSPNVIVIRGYGVVTAAETPRESKITMDFAMHSFRVASAASAIGRNRFVSERESFEMEYWPPQEAKLKKHPRKPLDGYVAVVTGAASGIGKVSLRRFAEEGMVAVGCDIDKDIVEVSRNVDGESLPLVFDISREGEVKNAFAEIVKKYGGVDVIFNNAGYLKPSPIDETSLESLRKHVEINSIGTFLITREAFKIMKVQGVGGVFIFNATKNVTNPGEGMMAYGSSKAFVAQLSRYVALEGGKYGIRSNVLNPDKVFRESKIWEDGVLENRAKAKGMSVEDYKRGNLLRVEVLPEHVANIAIELIKDSIFGATTGTMIPVDGGIK
ncbi:MAG: bifunctional aldolase/short-chain dehydrogenase [Thermoplasmatales archaeon]